MRFNLIKYTEGVIALYAASVGTMMIALPDQVAHAVYAPWHRAGATIWGAALLSVAAAHVGALILNGRNRVVSRIMRAVANSAHLYLSLHFALMFGQSAAAWGVLTFGLLVPALLMPIAASTIIDAMDAVHDRRGHA